MLMEFDPMQYLDEDGEREKSEEAAQANKSRNRLNTLVAITKD
jgi:hypothetical protein